MLQVFDGFHASTEDEDIFLANFLINLDISPIHSAYDESSIHDKLHIGSS
jgi:hypothetical protein